MTDQKLVLNAIKREITGKEVRQLRAEGMTPAVLYGRGLTSMHLSVPSNELEKVFKLAGENTIINLNIEGSSPVNVLINEVDTHITKGNLMHADFYQVRMDEKITTTVPLEFIGESVAVKQLGGTLVPNISEIEIECLPGDIPHNIEVDVSILSDFEKVIRVLDLKVNRDKISILTESDQLVVRVEEPRSEEEIAELEKAPEEIKVEEIEGVVKEKDEEGETSEAETPKEHTDENSKEEK